MQIRHLPPLLRFIPQFAQICIVFALSKFEANPFFRPVYEAMSLTFDDRASLYLVQYVERQPAEDNRNDHPLAIAVILLQVYVDDIMTSLNTNDEAIKARE